MTAEHPVKQILDHTRLRAVLVHPNLLRDDAALLFHALRREIRLRDQPQEDLQVLLKFLRAVEIIGRHGIAREGVRTAAVRGKKVHRVVLRQVEHLVLQIVRDAVRHTMAHAAECKLRVDGAEIHAQKGIAAGKARLRHHADAQAVRQDLLPAALAQLGIFKELHASTPSRKNTVSVRILCAARTRSSLLSRVIFSISASTLSPPAMAFPI